MEIIDLASCAACLSGLRCRNSSGCIATLAARVLDPDDVGDRLATAPVRHLEAFPGTHARQRRRRNTCCCLDLLYTLEVHLLAALPFPAELRHASPFTSELRALCAGSRLPHSSLLRSPRWVIGRLPLYARSDNNDRRRICFASHVWVWPLWQHGDFRTACRLPPGGCGLFRCTGALLPRIGKHEPT